MGGLPGVGNKFAEGHSLFGFPLLWGRSYHLLSLALSTLSALQWFRPCSISFSPPNFIRHRPHLPLPLCYTALALAFWFLCSPCFSLTITLSTTLSRSLSCWLSLEGGLLYAFVGPAAAVVLVLPLSDTAHPRKPFPSALPFTFLKLCLLLKSSEPTASQQTYLS